MFGALQTERVLGPSRRFEEFAGEARRVDRVGGSLRGRDHSDAVTVLNNLEEAVEFCIARSN